GRGKLCGPLRGGLSAAAKDGTGRQAPMAGGHPTPADPAPPTHQPAPTPSAVEPREPTQIRRPARPLPSAAAAARAARGGTPNIPPVARHVEFDVPPTTRIVKPEPMAHPEPPARTQLVRGRQPVKRGRFYQDPVV